MDGEHQREIWNDRSREPLGWYRLCASGLVGTGEWSDSGRPGCLPPLRQSAVRATRSFVSRHAIGKHARCSPQGAHVARYYRRSQPSRVSDPDHRHRCPGGLRRWGEAGGRCSQFWDRSESGKPHCPARYMGGSLVCDRRRLQPGSSLTSAWTMGRRGRWPRDTRGSFG
jgi:hypothetical protein